MTYVFAKGISESIEFLGKAQKDEKIISSVLDGKI